MLRRPVESARYLSIKYTERLAEEGIDPSIGCVHDSYDNAPAECVIGLFKAEVINFFGHSRSVAQIDWPRSKMRLLAQS